MNRIIPFTNSIILYFLFPFFISKFSKSKNFFQNFFCRKLYIVGNFGLRTLPPPYVYMLIPKIFHHHTFSFLSKSSMYIYTYTE